MARLSKKTPVVVAGTGAKPITDFFTRKSAIAPSPKGQNVSSQSVNVNPSKVTSKSAYTNYDASSSASHTFLDTLKVASSTSSAVKPQYPIPPTLSITKRASSNSSSTGSLSSQPGPGSSRNPDFDSDSDLERPTPSVYILRSPPPSASAPDIAASAPVPVSTTENMSLSSHIRINPKKKRRLLSPESCSDLVPTSQSDELEIASAPLPQRDLVQVKQSVEEWRHNAAFADSPSLEKASFNVHSLIVEGSPSSDGARIPSLPSTPQALDPTTKAERIIAKIKARAYAAMQNYSETFVREFKDELSDSDDDIFPQSLMKEKRTVVSKTLQTVSSHKRQTLRTPDTAPSPSAQTRLSGPFTVTTRSRVSSTRVPANISTQTVKYKSKNWNPLDDLLKEKKRDDQHGKGSKAFHQAQAALANRNTIMIDADDEAYTDETAARKAVMERDNLSLMSSSPEGYDVSDSEDEVNEHDHKRLLGEKHGKAIANLLECDKVSRQKEKDIEKPVGVPLWHDNETSMDVDENTLPKLEISTSHPLLSALHGAIDRNDATQAALLIGSGSISSVVVAENSALIPFLCDLALLAEGTVLSKSAIQALTRVWGASVSTVPGISFSCILATLARLGAQPTILNAMGWNIPTTNTNFIHPSKRDSLLYRLITLINNSALSRRLSSEEIPDILLAMILVANDPSSSAELQREVVLAMHAVCGSIASGCDICASLESTICTKVLKYSSTLEPVNKAYVTALFGSGSGRTRRLGSWIAHGIITDKVDVSPHRYSDLPPILPLIGELTKQRSSAADPPGKFEQHDNTDFVDMTFYVGILGAAITNIVGYVMEERKTPRALSSGNATPSTQPQEAPLVLLRTAIETLHAQISDIRATHLDRSRTKAALKELSLRIHYQRQVAQQSFRTLHTYFSRNS